MNLPHRSSSGTKAHPVQSWEISDRLKDQIEWFDEKSVQNKRAFQRLKYTQIVAAAAIPVVTAFEILPREAAAILAGIVLVIESILQLNQYHQNWITYRSTAEALKREQVLYLANARHYKHDSGSTARLRLADRVEAIISQGHAKWVESEERMEREFEEAQNEGKAT